MSFGELQLKKYGWTEGKGLGREENGISVALKPKLKFDTSGFGHDRSEEFTFHWWDHVYNKAANNLSVQKNEIGKIEIVKSQPLEVSTKKSSIKNKTPSYYGNFIKGSVLEGNKMVPEIDESQTCKSSIKQEEKSLELINTISDKELFKLCGGLTGHKAARHGIRMSAKLARLEQQEKEFINSRSNDTDEYKSKKRKRKLLAESNLPPVNPPVEICEDMSADCEETKSKKKKKKKRKHKEQEELIENESVSENNEEVSGIAEVEMECDEPIKLKHKKKKKKKRKENLECDL